MHSEVPRYIKVAAGLGLFSYLMKYTVVNESLSINNLMFCKESNSTVSIYCQQNETSTQNKSALYNCGIEAENNFLLESLAACHDLESILVMYFMVNTAFVNYLDNQTESLKFQILLNWTYSQTDFTNFSTIF